MVTYEYWFSEDYGRTYRMVGLIGEDSRARVEAQPITGKRYRRRFVPAR